MEQVKILLTNRFDPDVRVYKEAKYLLGKGYDVEILCWDRQNEYNNNETEIIDGIRIKRFYPYSEYGTGLKQIKPYIYFIKECRKYLKDKSYQYLHCHDLDGVIAGYFARKNKARIIFDMHEFYEINGRKQKIKHIVRMVVRKLQSKSDYIIYVNKLQTEVVLKKNKHKLVYLPNYPEISYYEGYKKTVSDKLRISYIGSVRQYIELKNLMDACIGMDDVKIAIHGSGVAYNKLNGIKNNYDNVNITGKYDFLQSAKLYSETDVLYALYPISSKQYLIAYPIKFFEAIITLTPLIVNTGTVLEEFIRKYDIGFVVDGSDIKKIRELIQFINNNRHVLDEKARNLENIQFDYSWEEIVKNLDKIYE